MRQPYLAVIIATIVLFGCASTPQPLQALPLPPQKIMQPGYSLLPLNEKDWFAGPRNQYQLSLVKHGGHADESFAIQGIASRLPVFATADEFLQIVKEGQAADTASPRFKIVSHSVVEDTLRQTQCARSHLVAEDSRPVKRTTKVGSMILEVSMLVCAHPNSRELGISIIYSHRYYPGQADSAFMQKADQVMSGVEFTSIGSN